MNEWIYYPYPVGESYAWVYYDHGIRETIDALAPTQLLKVQLLFKYPMPNGFPPSEESAHLAAVEEELQDAARRNGAFYVRQVSAAGARRFYIYASDSRDTWASRIGRLGQRHGYELSFTLAPDEGHDGYWKELFPTEDQWRIVEDLRVIAALQEEGDNADARRRIDHWAYFSSAASVDRFCRWARESGYGTKDNTADEDDRYRVHLFHEGTMHWQDITSHTMALRHGAANFGGEYDGWEAEVTVGRANKSVD